MDEDFRALFSSDHGERVVIKLMNLLDFGEIIDPENMEAKIRQNIASEIAQLCGVPRVLRLLADNIDNLRTTEDE